MAPGFKGLNLDVGSKTWRFNPDAASASAPAPNSLAAGILGTGPPRSGSFARESGHDVERYDLDQDRLIEQGVDPDAVVARLNRRTRTAEAVHIEREKRALADERDRLAELNQRQMAEEELQRQIREEQDALDAAQKRELLEEAEMRLDALRNEVAALEQKHQTDLLAWEERQQRTAVYEAELERRAREREEEETRKAAQRQAELESERTSVLENLRREALEEYRRAHEEIQQAQREQLQREVDEARAKIAEETAQRRAALEVEKEEAMKYLREQAAADYQKHLQEQERMYQLRLEEEERRRKEDAIEAKRRANDNLRALWGHAGQRFPSRGPDGPPDHPRPPSSAQQHLDPIDQRRLELSRTREAALRGALKGIQGPGMGMHPAFSHPGMMQGDDWHPPPFGPGPGPRGPPNIIGVSPASGWGAPTPRQRSASFTAGGRTPAVNNIRGPFPPNSNRHAHLMRPGPGGRLGPYPHSARFAPLGTGRIPDLPFATPQQGFKNGWGAPPLPPPGGLRREASRNQVRPTPLPEQDEIEEAEGSVPPLLQPTARGRGRTLSGRPQTLSRAPSERPQPRFPDPPRPPTSMSAAYDQDGLEGFCVVTVESVPGFQVTAIMGEVTGSFTREVPRTPANEHERESARKSALNDRRRAVSDMIRTAAGMGANGVVGLRFAQNRLEGYHSEITAYGTAVVLTPAHADAVAPPVDAATQMAAADEAGREAGPAMRAKKPSGKVKSKTGRPQQRSQPSNDGWTQQDWGGSSNEAPFAIGNDVGGNHHAHAGPGPSSSLWGSLPQIQKTSDDWSTDVGGAWGPHATDSVGKNGWDKSGAKNGAKGVWEDTDDKDDGDTDAADASGGGWGDAPDDSSKQQSKKGAKNDWQENQAKKGKGKKGKEEDSNKAAENERKRQEGIKRSEEKKKAAKEAKSKEKEKEATQDDDAGGWGALFS